MMLIIRVKFILVDTSTSKISYTSVHILLQRVITEERNHCIINCIYSYMYCINQLQFRVSEYSGLSAYLVCDYQTLSYANGR